MDNPIKIKLFENNLLVATLSIPDKEAPQYFNMPANFDLEEIQPNENLMAHAVRQIRLSRARKTFRLTFGKVLDSEGYYIYLFDGFR